MHRAHNSFGSLTAVARDFYDPAVADAALGRARAIGHLTFGAAGMAPDPVSESVWKLWVAQPSRMRAEQSGHRRGRPPGPCTMVVDGQQWWTYDEKYGARFGTGAPQQMSSFTDTGFEALLDPRVLLNAMRGFSLSGTTSVAGREAIRLRARRGGDGRDVFATEIAVDAERGVALRVVERFDGEIVQVRELTSVQFDIPIHDEVFTFVPPDGEEALPLPVSSSVTVEEAAVVCPFTVFVPAEIPGGAEVELDYWPGWQRDGLPGPTLTVSVRHDRHAVLIEQWKGFRCCLNEPARPQPVTRNGQTVLVATDSNGRHSIETRRGDTGIELHSRGDLELLVSLATCLVPASATDPPPWSPAALSRGAVFAVPLGPPAPPPEWRHPDVAAPGGLGALLEVVYGKERRDAGLRATVTTTWYGRPSGPRPDPPVTTQTEMSADLRQPGGSGSAPYEDLLEPRPLISTFDLDSATPVEVEGRAAVRATATQCAWIQFPRRPATILRPGSLIDWDVERVDLVIDLEAGFLLAARTWAGDQLVREVNMQYVTLR